MLFSFYANRNYMFFNLIYFIFISILNRYANKRKMYATLHDRAVAVKAFESTYAINQSAN